MTRRTVFAIGGQAIGGAAVVAVALPVVGFALRADLRPPGGDLGGGRIAGRLHLRHLPPGGDHDRRRRRRLRQDDRLHPPRQRRPRRGSRRVHRDLDPLRPPRLPGPLRPGRRQLHLPLPRRRLRLRGPGDRRPAGAPARPLPDPRHRRTRSRSAPATASPPTSSRSAPATRASSPAGSGSTSTRRDPTVPPTALMPKLPFHRLCASPASPASGPTAPGRNGGGNGGRARDDREARARRSSTRPRRAGSTSSAGSTSAPARRPFLTGMLLRKVPKGTNWFYTLGSATLFAFAMQALTGVFLAMFYVPSSNEAYNSITHLTNDVFLGEFVRGLHKWGATLMIILIFLHMAQDLLLRRLQVPARAQLGDRGRAADPHPGDGPDRLPAAVRPALLLGDDRGHEHHRLRARWWARTWPTSCAPARSSAPPPCRASTPSTCCWCPGLIIALIGAHLYLVVKLGTTAPPWLRADPKPKSLREEEL